MNPRFVNSLDGTRIAYDCSGTGPAIVLVHGGGGNRQEWHSTGYVERLHPDFTVITLDLRGHGDSDLPTEPAAYRVDKMGQDILAVAEACGAERFTLWGMSFGGKISRHLVAQSGRVAKAILMGVPLGPAVSEELRQEILGFCERWTALLSAHQTGALDLETLAEEDREFHRNFNVPVIMAWGQAMLAWPAIEPADLRCPTLWLVGSEDPGVMASVQEYQPYLAGSQVQLQIAKGLSHEQVFEEIDQVFGMMLAFTQS